MKKFARILAVVMAVLMVSLCFVACGNKLSGTYVGEEEGLEVSYTFKGDEVTMEALGIEIKGTYEIDGDKITIKTELLGMENSEELDFKKGFGYIEIDGVKLEKE